MKKAFITGIGGQDGSYLAEYLLELGYEVHGILRRNSTPEHQDSRISHLEDKIYTYYGDLLDQGGLERLLDQIQPDHVTPAVTYMVSEDAPTGVIMSAGAGVFARVFVHETMGVNLGTGEDMTAENIAEKWDEISDMKDARPCYQGGEQSQKIFELIMKG